MTDPKKKTEEADKAVQPPIKKSRCILDIEVEIETLKKIKAKERTPEEKKLLEKLRKSIQRVNETKDQRESRQKKDQEQKKVVRDIETAEERKERQRKDQEQKKDVRDNETAEERKARQRKVQEQMKINRDNETAEERKARQKKDKEQKKFENDNETIEERKTRQNNNQMQKKVAREKETDIETKERKQKDKNHKRILNRSRTELGRLNRFKETVRYGPIYTCCVCEQDMFKNSVTNLTEKFESDIRNKSPMLCENALKNKHRHLVNIHRIKDGKREPESELYYICTTCKKHLSKGNLPPMAAANGLELMTLDDKDLQLSELESNLIAKTLLFQKIYLLPKSRCRLDLIKEEDGIQEYTSTSICGSKQDLQGAGVSENIWSPRLYILRRLSYLHKKMC